MPTTTTKAALQGPRYLALPRRGRLAMPTELLSFVIPGLSPGAHRPPRRVVVMTAGYLREQTGPSRSGLRTGAESIRPLAIEKHEVSCFTLWKLGHQLRSRTSGLRSPWCREWIIRITRQDPSPHASQMGMVMADRLEDALFRSCQLKSEPSRADLMEQGYRLIKQTIDYTIDSLPEALTPLEQQTRALQLTYLHMRKAQIAWGLRRDSEADSAWCAAIAAHKNYHLSTILDRRALAEAIAWIGEWLFEWGVILGQQGSQIDDLQSTLVLRHNLALRSLDLVYGVTRDAQGEPQFDSIIPRSIRDIRRRLVASEARALAKTSQPPDDMELSRSPPAPSAPASRDKVP